MHYLSLLTLVHVIISLIAIVQGAPAIRSIIAKQNRSTSVVLFFLFTALTTLSGFAFPIVRFTPGIAFGLLTLMLLAISFVSNRKADKSRGWQFVYFLSALTALYLNCIVLIVQSFQKIEVLKTLAPTQSEPPVLIAQVILLLAVLLVGWKGFRSCLYS